MKKYFKNVKRASLYCLILISAILMMRCEFDLPEEGSIEDLTPPESGFSFRQDAENQLLVIFTNESNSATIFSWDFGDGNTSDEADPSNTYSEFGTYTVTLIAEDNLGVVDTLTQDIEVLEGPLQPIIFESGFEDFSPGAGDCDGGEGRSDGRDCWLNGDLGGILQISEGDATNKNIHAGLQSAKLPGLESSERIGYQLVAVDTAQDYRLTFFYNLENNVPGGFVTVSVLNGPVSSKEEAEAATIGTFTGTDQSDPSTFVQGAITFNSGDSDEIAIYFFNNRSEVARLDDFVIEVTEAGFLPPTASFSAEPSMDNIFEYNFANSSVNAANYTWDFGDGSALSTEENPVHAFPAIDTFTVTLVAESQFFTTDTFRLDVVIPDPVSASFEYTSDPGDVRIVSFSNTSTEANSYLWDFGDGSGFFSTAESPSYTYSAEGFYDVTLTATGVSGVTSETTMQLNLNTAFVVQVLNGTFDEFTFNTGDNADAWDMTPNSTVVDNSGNTIDSPYRPIWRNTDLDSWLATNCGDDSEQPGSTSDGNNNTRGGKLEEPCRRLYQLVEVQAGVEYTFSIDSRTSAASMTTEIFILNTEIADETGINASTSDAAIDQYFAITNDFNTDSDVFVTSTFNFTPSTSQIVIYVRNEDAVDNVAEAFYDNVEITTP